MQARAHVAVLNAAGKATAAKHGLHIVDFELMTSRFEQPANYLAVCVLGLVMLFTPLCIQSIQACYLLLVAFFHFLHPYCTES